MRNQESTFSRLSGEVRGEQKGWYKRGWFFGLINRDTYYLQVRTRANGQTFWHFNEHGNYPGFNPKDYLITVMEQARVEAIKKLTAPKFGSRGTLMGAFTFELDKGKR